jgi:UDP-N-acetylmuramyl pentapeptide phosphotransferase/UDP-N-acetylglucosamine-1-phosphate transferase
MTVFGFSCYGAAAFFSGNHAFALLNFSIASAAAAFLLFNFHPARIFMGDAGSIPLGFLAGCLGLIGWLRHDWAWWFPLLVFSPFIVDASVTLLKRAYARAAIWQAHRDHYYQRLVQMGWGHRRTALAEYLLMFLCGAGALAGSGWTQRGQTALLMATVAIYAALIVSVEMAWHKARKMRRHES